MDDLRKTQSVKIMAGYRISVIARHYFIHI